jgi:hypothetical protein
MASHKTKNLFLKQDTQIIITGSYLIIVILQFGVVLLACTLVDYKKEIGCLR